MVLSTAQRPLNKFEISKLVGIRALQIAHGDAHSVTVTDPVLKSDAMYLAALELYEGKLDALVKRDSDVRVHPKDVGFCDSLALMLDLKDNGKRMACDRTGPQGTNTR